ncbi:cell division protein ZapA [Thalassolituus sp.]|uniref:cell division protein ZapA n=1 Tax=Thalassolituus sp. TaxID=2030822 RepID=UPI003513AD18|nr:MAG: cell division protein ZapA [Thalassolituus sp.]
MANSSKTLALTILDREYRVNCPQGAETDLREAARFLNEKMEEIRDAGSKAGKVLGTDRIAVIAALNITHQLLDAEHREADVNGGIQRISDRIDALLAEDSQLEL